MCQIMGTMFVIELSLFRRNSIDFFHTTSYIYIYICTTASISADIHVDMSADISADISAATSAHISARTSAGRLADISADVPADISADMLADHHRTMIGCNEPYNSLISRNDPVIDSNRP